MENLNRVLVAATAVTAVVLLAVVLLYVERGGPPDMEWVFTVYR